MTLRRGLIALAAILLLATPVRADDHIRSIPSKGPARSIGGAANGCLAGGQSLPLTGDGWAVLRPDRNRFWGNPALLTYLRDMTARSKSLGTALVGDMSQPRGGQMPSGHGSHQTGLDADILFRLADKPLSNPERDQPVMDSVLLPSGKLNPHLWGKRQTELLHIFAADSRVERIFVNPAIKVALCQGIKGDRGWLRRIRPWWGHDEHFHVRIQCPIDDMDCQSGPPLPDGDGCGAELQSWIKSGAWAVKPTGGKRAAQIPPAACREILGREILSK